jgi:quercetin dioxygenase-like cupin family protein
VPAETHYFTQLGVVLRGKMSMTFGDGTQQHYGPNELYAIAPGMVHGAHFPRARSLSTCTRPTILEFEALFAQQRERVDKKA